MVLELVVRAEESRAPSEAARASEGAATQTIDAHVAVGAGWLSYWEQPGRRVVLDFDRRRKVTIDVTSRSYVDESLFTVVGMRHIELPNRAHIRSVLEAGGGNATDFAPLRVEHQLAVLDPARSTTLGGSFAGTRSRSLVGAMRSLLPTSRADIEGELRGSEVVYSAEGTPLFRHSADGEGTQGSARALAQYIRYRYGGHPLLLERLATLDFVPREVAIDALAPFGLGVHAVRLRVESVRQDPERPSTTGLREVFPIEIAEPGDELLDASRAATLPAEAADARVMAATDALRSGRGFDGTLSFFELTLESGTAMPPEFAQALNASSDGAVRYLLTAIGEGSRPGPGSADKRRLALQTYEELAPLAKAKAHVLWAFEAGVRVALGEEDLAKQLLLRAIARNPRLTAAYKDLGDLYLQAFDTHRAWRSWEVARSIAPNHPVMRSIDEFEQRLLRSHPEYFAA
jgi:hypothetical protein